MATMADIAERAGVALSTVSYVLSGKRSISEETRQRVYQAIAELDYHPHALARGLASKRTRTIGLIFPALARGHSEMRLEFVTRAAEVAAAHGYAFLLWTASDDEIEILQLTQQGRVDGLILMEVKLHDSRVDMLKARNYPFTLIGHCENNDGISFVDLDFEDATATAVAHLAGLGHRQIVLFNHSADLQAAGYGPSVRSLRGFEAAVAAHGIRGLAVTSDPSFQSGYDITQSLLAEHPDLTAAIVTQETALAGMMRAFYDAELRIPDDFSLVTLLSARQAEIMTPALTSVDFPADEMGRIGAQMLIDQLEGNADAPVQRLLRANLTVRQSSAPARPRLVRSQEEA